MWILWNLADAINSASELTIDKYPIFPGQPADIWPPDICMAPFQLKQGFHTEQHTVDYFLCRERTIKTQHQLAMDWALRKSCLLIWLVHKLAGASWADLSFSKGQLCSLGHPCQPSLQQQRLRLLWFLGWACTTGKISAHEWECRLSASDPDHCSASIHRFQVRTRCAPSHIWTYRNYRNLSTDSIISWPFDMKYARNRWLSRNLAVWTLSHLLE